MKEKYPEFYDHIKNLSGKLARDLRGPMAAFAQLTGATTQPAALDTKTKRLIALGIGIAARCRGCIAIHMHDALQAGATREEILEPWGFAFSWGAVRAWCMHVRPWRSLTSLSLPGISQPGSLKNEEKMPRPSAIWIFCTTPNRWRWWAPAKNRGPSVPFWRAIRKNRVCR